MKRILEYVVLKDQPFMTAEDKSFQELIGYCNSNAKFPSDTTVRKEIAKLFESERQNVMELLKVKYYNTL